MRILLAPDSFKGSLRADQVAAALARGLRAADPTSDVDEAPAADGGEGTVRAAVAAGLAERRLVVSGPLLDTVDAAYAVRDDTAVVELAECCGIERVVGDLDGAVASSRGLGEAVADAVRRGASTVIVGLGGSASTDGGAGMLQALGAEVHDADGRPVGPGARGLLDVADVDLRPALYALEGVELVAACDVDNPLLGPAGAAHVFGPQKGLDDHGVARAERALTALADATPDGRRLADLPGAGAAGGTGFALLALGARFRPGIDVVVELLDLERRIAAADVLVVGEGSLDEQSARGKGPVGLATIARDHGVRVVAVAGRSDLDGPTLSELGIESVQQLRDLEPDLDVCVRDAERLLEEIGRRLAAHLVG